MEVCDAALVDCVIPERETNCVLNRINADQEQDGADQVEVEVYHRGTAGILGAATEDRNAVNTGTDVLTEMIGDSSRIGDSHQCRQRLQNTNRRGGRLDDRGNARADQHAEHRIGDSSEQIRELRQISQRCNRALHDRHADEQNTEAGEDIRDIAGTALFASIIMITPTSTMIYARFFGLSRSMNRLPLPSPPDRRRICAVTVVPMLAPRITPTDCLSVMIPAFTKRQP